MIWLLTLFTDSRQVGSTPVVALSGCLIRERGKEVRDTFPAETIRTVKDHSLGGLHMHGVWDIIPR